MFTGLDRNRSYGGIGKEVAMWNGRHGALRAKGRTEEIANYNSGKRETASMSTSASAYGGLTDEDLSLNYIGGSSNKKGSSGSGNVPQQVYKWYDAIFREDSICGAAIELRSNIPYGDFTLSGVQKNKLQKYEEAVDNMRLRSMMPRIAIERDVMGSFFGMLDWNGGNKTYDSMLPYSRQFISSIIYSPVYGMDPVVDIELSALLRELLDTTDQRADAIKKCIPKFLSSAKGQGNGIPVPMDSVVWIDRPHTDPRFNSMLHRILPIFLIERAITRGTIESAQRRQRGIAHITAGQGDLWLATEEEMAQIADLFTNADADPIGATVVTREGIMYNEVRQPTDFWRITDSYEQTVPFKLRALGISESFMSGDATFNNAEVAISTFLQTIKAERNQVTDQLIYRKIFAQIAEANNYKKGGRETGDYNQGDLFISLRELEMAANAANTLGDISIYDIPRVTWKQSLMPEGDQAYISMLKELEEAGVPPPIRVMFAAGGMDFDTVMNNAAQDIQDRKNLTKYIEKIRENSPEPVNPEEGNEFASLRSVGGQIGILNRTYDDSTDLYADYNNGRKSRPMTTKGKEVLTDRHTREMAYALARHAERHNAMVRAGVEM